MAKQTTEFWLKKEEPNAVVFSLLNWYQKNKRSYPWRETNDVYKIWICEIMSQQTLLSVVLPKYNRFINTLPTVNDLADADEVTLRSLWAGLGYYARARNLQKGAQYILSLGGFPHNYTDWLSVPGVGPYTASMIASRCFFERKGAVDGNVIRVVSRLTGFKDVWNQAAQKEIQKFVDTIVPAQNPGDFNQAMMELGATLCRKQIVGCAPCPVRGACVGLKTKNLASLPPPKPKQAMVDVKLRALVIENQHGDFLLGLRSQGFLRRTFGFPLLVGEELAFGSQILGKFKHTITKHKIAGTIGYLKVADESLTKKITDSIQLSDTKWFPKDQLEGLLAASLDRKAWSVVKTHKFTD